MSSAALSNSGMASRLQLLSNAGLPTLASELASPTVEAALQNAPGEVVQMVSQAVESQEAQGLFKPPAAAGPLPVGTPAEAAFTPSSLLGPVAAPAAGSPMNSGSLLATEANPTDLAGQSSSYEVGLQAQQLQNLFAVNPPEGSTSNTLNLLA